MGIPKRIRQPKDPDFYFGNIDAATLIDMGYADKLRRI